VAMEVVATKAKNPHQHTFSTNVAGRDDITQVCKDVVEYVHRRGIGGIAAEKIVPGMVFVTEISKIATININTLNGGFMEVSDRRPELPENCKSQE